MRPGQVRPGIVRGRLRVPPSKSVSHRQLALALLARAPVNVRHLLRAEDTELFLGALRRLGWTVEERGERGEETVRLVPGSPPEAATFECGNAGTLLRFLVALVATVPGEWTLDGSPRLRERPVGPLVEALRALGVEVRWRGVEGFPPLTVIGGTLSGGETTVDAGESSQYVSALLLAALAAREPTLVRVAALASAPYVDVTLEAIAQWGGRVERREDGFVVSPGLSARDVVEVEGDFSASAYPAAAAALTRGDVTLLGLRRASAQGDRQFIELLARMGTDVTWSGDELRVRGGEGLTAVDVDLGAMPDQVPTLAALAPFARGATAIRNVAHLRIKESDRLAAMALELRRAGAEVEELADGLVIPGLWADATPEVLPRTPVVIDSHGDHRIAMSMALVGLRRPGLQIANPEVVGKSYPRFWDDLATLLGEGNA
ncbi:MAG TPA: 3-phosphoshikimate 1-carboxyvinyltransferase [Thermoanaerobaculia bacterium]|nr:3-phosphoshikimate 1-carboxyvinyltransferase [Thermoanaerobaculia bacterium]